MLTKEFSPQSHLISIHFSVPFFPHYFSATENVHVFCYLHTCISSSLKNPSRKLSVSFVNSVDSVKPVFAMCKATLLKIRYLLSLSFFLFYSLSPFLSFPLFFLLVLLPFSLLLSLFRLSLLLDFYSLRSRSASNISEKGNEDTGTQCALNRSLDRSLSRH